MIQEDYTTEYKVKVMQAYLEGKSIEFIVENRNWELWTSRGEPLWNWGKSQYRIAEEPKRIPFDGGDAFDLVGQKFQHVNPQVDTDIYLCTQATSKLVVLSDTEIKYDELSKYYEKWNDLLKIFEPCNKIA
jgi:hypothetical protein